MNLFHDFGNSLDPWSEREIDSLLEKEEVYTNLQELQKYSNEKKEIENQIEKCMERWEICSQQLP